MMIGSLGYPEPESTALSFLTAGSDATVMALDNTFTNRQPEPRSAFLASISPGYLLEALENRVHQMRRNTATLIDYLKLNLLSHF